MSRDKILYTIEEAAEQLSESVAQVRMFIHHGYLRVVKHGRNHRIHWKSLEAVANTDIPSLWPKRPWPAEREAQECEREDQESQERSKKKAS